MVCCLAFNSYQSIMESRSKKIAADNDLLMEQTIKVYMELLEVKKELTKNQSSNSALQ